MLEVYFRAIVLCQKARWAELLWLPPLAALRLKGLYSDGNNFLGTFGKILNIHFANHHVCANLGVPSEYARMET